MLERVDRAHRALQAFTADASHELRTPLTHLRARVQWAVAEGRTEGEMREALGAMERVLDQTAKLVEELLLIARGENRQLALAHAPFELGAVVNEVREITEAMALGRELTVSAASSPPLWALGDADRTRHILLNLASNAVRYTPSGSVTFALERNGTMVGVSVRDTGPGIAPEHVERIFDRFFRVDQSRSRRRHPPFFGDDFPVPQPLSVDVGVVVQILPKRCAFQSETCEQPLRPRPRENLRVHLNICLSCGGAAHRTCRY